MGEEMLQIALDLPPDTLPKIFGHRDANLLLMENLFSVKITARGGRIKITGETADTRTVSEIFLELSRLIASGKSLDAKEIESGLKIAAADPAASLADFFTHGDIAPCVTKFVKPRSPNQKRYLEAISSNDMVVAIGPAGTGKTYLAVAMACAYLLDKRVRRIILTRPAVEAGERLGFLPGDIAAKVDPYLRPLYDALYDMIGYEKVTRLIERGIIEIAPLAFMRGRTLNDAFIILDEAQNTTSEQMKMFLTRMGFSSRTVITGDITQVDLPAGKKSGLKEIKWILKEVHGIMILEMDERDVVRHPLVQEIIGAYERAEHNHEE